MRPENSRKSRSFITIEGGIYKLWYHGGGYFLGGRGRRYGAARIGYATSPDGLKWTKHVANPVLDVGPPGSFDDEQVAEARVFKLADGYRMYYTGANEQSGRKSLGIATSSDGLNWTKDARNPILDSNRWGNFWGGAFFCEKGVWYLWHASDRPKGGSLNFKWSRDGISWVDGAHNPVLTVGSVLNAPDTLSLGDSVSGYRDENTFRIMYTGDARNLFGSLGRFDGICMASIEAAIP